MKVGFTGTREGMSEAQRAEVAALLEILRPIEFHHGDCLGADAQANAIAAEISWKTNPETTARPCLVAHPCNIVGMRAHSGVHLRHPAKPPLERNRDIVDACDVLIVAPRHDAEEMRSGTWATVRYARKAGKPVRIVYADGEVVAESNTERQPRLKEVGSGEGEA